MSRVWNNIREDERREAIGAFLTLFGVMAAHSVLETARDALFLARLPASHLPFVYLAIAVLAMVFSLSKLRVLGRQRSVRALSMFLLASALVTSVFWFLAGNRQAWVLYSLYVWSGLFPSIAIVHFWMVVSDRYNASQAKRVYGFVGVGAVLGATVGGFVALGLASLLDARHLLLGAVVVLLITGLGPFVLLARKEHGAKNDPPDCPECTLEEGIQILRGQPYLTRLLLFVTVSTVVLTVVDYMFKAVSAQHVQAADLGVYFSVVYTALNGLSLLVQLFLVNSLLRLLSVHRVLALLPLLLILGALGLILGGGLVAALALKGADGSLRHSTHRTSTELLFVPLAARVRAVAKPFIDIMGQRGGQALASLVILAAVGMGAGNTELGIGVVALGAVWIGSAIDLRGHYLDLFRTTLREFRRDLDAPMPALDLDALETLFAALNSPDDDEVLGALDLLAEQGRVNLIPGLLLHHPSKRVVLRALDLFGESRRGDIVPILHRLVERPDEQIRAAALRVWTTLAPERQLLQSLASDESALVRATARVGLIRNQWLEGDSPEEALKDLLDDPEPEVQLSLAQAIARQVSVEFTTTLRELAQHPDTKVRIEVARAMGQLKSQRFVPELMRMLAHRELRQSARKTLVAMGESVLKLLADALGNVSIAHEIRRHLPRTISRFDAHLAAPILLNHLQIESDGVVRYKFLRGLGRLQADNPRLKLDLGLLTRAVDGALVRTERHRRWRRLLEEGFDSATTRKSPSHELLVGLLRDKERRGLEQLFRLFGLQYPQEDWERIYRGLKSKQATVQSSSEELLEHILAQPLRDQVMSLVKAFPPRDQSPYPGYETILEEILRTGSDSLQCLAAYRVGELGLTHLTARLERLLQPSTRPFLSEVVERALAVLQLTKQEPAVAI